MSKRPKRQPDMPTTKMELVGALMDDEDVFLQAVEFLHGLAVEASDYGNDDLAAGFVRLADAFKRFDAERSMAVMQIIKHMEDDDATDGDA